MSITAILMKLLTVLVISMPVFKMDKGTPSCRISGDIIKNIEQKKYLIFCRMCLQPVERKIRSTPSRVPRASQQIIQTQGKLKEFLRQHNNIKGGLPLFFEII